MTQDETTNSTAYLIVGVEAVSTAMALLGRLDLNDNRGLPFEEQTTMTDGFPQLAAHRLVAHLHQVTAPQEQLDALRDILGDERYIEHINKRQYDYLVEFVETHLDDEPTLRKTDESYCITMRFNFPHEFATGLTIEESALTSMDARNQEAWKKFEAIIAEADMYKYIERWHSYHPNETHIEFTIDLKVRSFFGQIREVVDNVKSLFSSAMTTCYGTQPKQETDSESNNQS